MLGNNSVHMKFMAKALNYHYFHASDSISYDFGGTTMS